MWTFITWILVGLIAGALAKLILPGDQGGGWIRTALIGIAGAFVGGFIGSLFGIEITKASFNPLSLISATGGTILIFLAFEFIAKARKKGADKD